MIKHEAVTSCSLILTEKCNLSCTYCFESNKNHKAVMSKETARKVIDFLVNEAVTYNKDNFHITYFGGEPLLNLETLRDSYDYALDQAAKNKLDFDCMIITNATLFTEEYKEFLLHWNNTSRGINLQLSIDGIPSIQDKSRIDHAGKGTSAVVEEVVKQYVDFFKCNSIDTSNFSVHSVMTKESIRHMSESFFYFKSLGLDNIWNMPLHEEEWNDEDLEVFKSELKIVSDYIYNECVKAGNDNAFKQYSSLSKCALEKPDKPCSAGCSFVTFTTEGNIYPCHHFYFVDKDLCIGNLEEGIQDDKRMLFMEYGFENVFGDMCCEQCSNKACYTCIAANYTHNGNILIGFPDYCKLSRAEDEIRKELSLRLDKAGIHKSIYSTNSNHKCDCSHGDGHECGCNNNNELLDELIKDREFLKKSVELMDQNIVELNSKVTTLLEVVLNLSELIVLQASKEGEINEQ